MLDSLKPISKKHSIARVVASFILAQDILKLETIVESLKINPVFSRYQRKSLARRKTVNVNLTGSHINTKSDDSPVIGFIFEEFDHTGQLKNMIRVSNSVDINKGLIEFETRMYEGWSDFCDTMQNDLGAIFSTNTFYTQAINLSYLDEFKWESNTDIPVNEIFDVNSELINKKFLSSDNGSILMLSQSKELTVEEQTEISFNNRLKRISIGHQYALKFKEVLSSIEVLDSKLLKEEFDLAHDSNKDMLTDLLSEEVCSIIGL